MIIDEIGSAKEVAAAKSIAHRGVVLVSRRAWVPGCPPCPRAVHAMPHLPGLYSCLWAAQHCKARSSFAFAAPRAITCWPAVPAHTAGRHALRTHTSESVRMPPSAVQVGTAHGKTLEALMRNGELNGLIGGLHTVTVGDTMAKEGNG